MVINACRNLVLALSFDIVGGYTGYINLGHAAVFGIGAYTFGICVNAGVPVLLAGGAAVLLTSLFAGLQLSLFSAAWPVLCPGYLWPAQAL
jgi:branched-chain amino acid transport system permease protein